MPVIPGENPFHCETGSTWTQASETLSTVAIDIACAICSSDNPNNFPVPIEFGDLYTALTTGLVDVQDNSLSIFRLIRLQELHKFILLSGLSDTGEIYLLDFAAVLVRGKTPVEKLGHALGGLMVVLTLSGP